MGPPTLSPLLPDRTVRDPTYREALAYLYAFSAPNLPPRPPEDRARKLPRTRALLALLGHPERRFRSMLVAGTKGKGSTAAMLDAIVRAAGVESGLYTQPHLQSWRERTRLHGRPIEPDSVAALVEQIRPAVNRLRREQPELGTPTTFEVGTVLTLLAFAETGIRLGIVEVGVGGAQDATNAVDPLFVVLGPISLDHTATLGNTLAEIAAEKAGLFRSGGLALVGHQPTEALAVVERIAGQRGTRLERLGREWRWHPEDAAPARGPFTVTGPPDRKSRPRHLTGLTVPLLGRHQRDNATLAVAAACALERGGFPITPEAIRRGLATVDWPGRLQVLRERPWLVVDGAHNGDSAACLARSLRECFPARRTHLVIGTSEGKDVVGIFDALLPIADRLTVTTSSHERAVVPVTLAATAGAHGASPIVEPDAARAVATAYAEADPDDLVCVTGSLFLVAEAIEAMRGQDGR